MMGWAPLGADRAMNLTIYSYDGKVFVGLAADAGAGPGRASGDVGLSPDAFHRLTELSPARALSRPLSPGDGSRSSAGPKVLTKLRRAP